MRLLNILRRSASAPARTLAAPPVLRHAVVSTAQPRGPQDPGRPPRRAVVQQTRPASTRARAADVPPRISRPKPMSAHLDAPLPEPAIDAIYELLSSNQLKSKSGASEGNHTSGEGHIDESAGQHARTSPKKAAASKLRPDFLASLRLSFSSQLHPGVKGATNAKNTEQMNEGGVKVEERIVDDDHDHPEEQQLTTNELVQVVRNPLAPSPQLAQIHAVMDANAALKRTKNVQQAFDLIRESGLSPTYSSYLKLMHTYAYDGDVENTSAVLEELRNAVRIATRERARVERQQALENDAAHVDNSSVAGFPSATDISTVPPAELNRNLTITLPQYYDPVSRPIPGIHAYTALVRACVNANDIEAAFNTYTLMKKRNIIPSTAVYAQLMRVCSVMGQHRRAWKLFDFVRRETGLADERLFNAAIHLCADTENTERALTLLEDMSREGITSLSASTYNAVLRALASRVDYYAETFDLFAQMLRQGVVPDVATYNALLNATIKACDIHRLALLWNDMIDRSVDALVANTNGFNDVNAASVIAPIEGTFMRVFSGISTALRRATRFSKSKEEKVSEKLRMPFAEDGDLPFESDNVLSGSASSNSIHPATTTSEAVDVESDSSLSESESENEDIDASNVPTDHPAAANTTLDHPLHMLRLKVTQLRPAPLLAEAERLWDLIVSPPQVLHEAYNELSVLADRRKAFKEDSSASDVVPAQQPLFALTTPLVDAYLSALTRLGHPGLFSKAMSVYDNVYPQHRLTRSARSHMSVYGVVARDKRLHAIHGEEMWKRLQEADAALNASLKGLSEPERERRRAEVGFAAEHWKDYFRLRVNALTRVNDIDGAIKTIHEAKAFRAVGYVPELHFRDVRALVEKTLDERDDGNVAVYRELMRAMPEPPKKNNLEVVQDMLRARKLGGRWWGWEVMNVRPEQVLKEVRRKRSQQKQRIKIRKAMKSDRHMTVNQILQKK